MCSIEKDISHVFPIGQTMLNECTLSALLALLYMELVHTKTKPSGERKRLE